MNTDYIYVQWELEKVTQNFLGIVLKFQLYRQRYTNSNTVMLQCCLNGNSVISSTLYIRLSLSICNPIMQIHERLGWVAWAVECRTCRQARVSGRTLCPPSPSPPIPGKKLFL